MGTSQSSKGPAGKVPLVPSWVTSPESADGGIGNGSADGGSPEEQVQSSAILAPQPAVLLSPARGFAGVRRSLGTFARTGDTSRMRGALHHYVHTSYAGAGNATRRHGGTIRTAVSLYNALSGSDFSSTSESGLDRLSLTGRSAEEVMNAIVEAVRPVDGTQDGEAARVSIHDALADLLNQFPEANLLELSEQQRMFVIERYMSMDVFRRFQLDVGGTIQEKAADATTALSRLKEVRDYIRETISAAFRKLDAAGVHASVGTIGRVVQTALRDAFEVFESYTL